MALMASDHTRCRCVCLPLLLQNAAWNEAWIGLVVGTGQAPAIPGVWSDNSPFDYYPPLYTQFSYDHTRSQLYAYYLRCTYAAGSCAWRNTPTLSEL
ncbi:hypothetical protein HaLaN_12368, partial [Haematococcus lacustris]